MLFGLDQISLQQLLLLPENKVFHQMLLQQLLMFSDNYPMDQIVLVPFAMLSEFELQPLGLEIKKEFILLVFTSMIWVLSDSGWTYFSKKITNKNGWVQALKLFC